MVLLCLTTTRVKQPIQQCDINLRHGETIIAAGGKDPLKKKVFPIA